jgi:glycosidase
MRRVVLALGVSIAACAHPAPPPSSSAPADAEWWRDAVAYEIYPKSFADADGDGTGDLAGITGKLDVLAALGIDAIWLTPIHPSPSEHGYDVLDYRAVRPAFGTLADFDRLIAEAHRRKIRVLLDLVLNHSSDHHPWFVDAVSSTAARHRDYYLWSAAPKPGWARPWNGGEVWHRSPSGWYYGLFSARMPDLNLGNAAVEAEMIDAARFWRARGVDGFRVDAARHLFESEDGHLSDQPGSHALIVRMRAALERDRPGALWIAEAWTDTSKVATYAGGGREYQLAFGFDLAEAIKRAVKEGRGEPLVSEVGTILAAFGDTGFLAPFLSNHDQLRVMRALGGDAASARCAAAILFAMPGTPFIYYGEEIGMEGGPGPRDEEKRTPIDWTEVERERADPRSLWSAYRRLIALRHAEPALRGTIAQLDEPLPAGMVAFLRTRGPERMIFVARLGEEAAITLEAGELRLAEGLRGSPQIHDGKITLELDRFGFAFLRLPPRAGPRP